MEKQGPQETTGPHGHDRVREGKTQKVDFFDTAAEVIDLRSFSNLWYWIALAVLWSSASHWVMGVPHDMIYRARRLGNQAEVDLQDIARVYAARVLDVADTALVFVIGFACFWFTALGTLAFYYDIEFAQALFFLMAPMTVVVWHSIRTARKIAGPAATGQALFDCLLWHRRVTQLVGMISVTVTGLYGMWQNFNVSIIN